MSVKVGEMFFELVGRDKAFHRMLDKAESGAKRLGRSLTSIGTRMTAAVTVPLIGIGAAALKSASDLEEVRNKTREVFGQGAQDMFAFGDSAAQSIGMARAEALELSSTLGLITQNLGFTRERSQEVSKEMLQLAADVASFRNVQGGAAAVTEAMTSALVGERERLKMMGIVITEAMVKTQMLADGTANLTGEAAQAAKAEATLSLIRKQAANDMGDFARTSDQLENQLRILKATAFDLAGEFGEVLIPYARDAAQWLGQLGKRIADMDPETKKLIVGVAAVAAAMGPLLLVAGQVSTAIGALSGVLAGLSAPVAAAVAAIGALTATFVSAYASDEQFRESVNAALSAIKEAVTDAAGAIADLWQQHGDELMEITTTTWAVIAEAIAQMLGKQERDIEAHTQKQASAWGLFWRELRNRAEDGMELVAATLQVILTAMQEDWTAHGNAVERMQAAYDRVLGKFVDGWKQVGRDVADAVGDMASSVKSAVSGMATGAVASARSLYTGVKSWLVDKWNSIVSGVQRQIDRVKAAFRSLYHAVVGGSYIPDMVTEVKAWMERLGSDALVDPATAATKEAAEAFSRMNEEIKSIIADLGQALRTEQRWARLTGDEWAAMAAEARLLESAIRKLLETRSWESAEVQALWAHYQMLTRSVNGHEAALEHLAEQEQQAAEAAEEAANAREQQRQTVQAFIDGEQQALVDSLREEENEWERKARTTRAMLDLYPELNAELTKLIELYDMWAQKVRDQEVAQKRLNESLQQTLAMAGQWADVMTEEFVRVEAYGRDRAEYMAGVLGAEPTVDVEEALDRIPEVGRVAEEAGATIWDYISVLGSRSFKALGNSARDVMGTIMGLLERLGVRSNSVFGRLLGAASSFFSVSAGPLGIVGGLVAGIGSIFGLADGGTIRTPGPVMVGERGPELLHLPRAATVQPLQAAGAAASAGAGGPLHLTLELDGRAIARGTMPHLSREMHFRGVTG